MEEEIGRLAPDQCQSLTLTQFLYVRLEGLRQVRNWGETILREALDMSDHKEGCVGRLVLSCELAYQIVWHHRVLVFPVPTATFRVLFVFVVLAHNRRRVIHFNVTGHPTAAWTAQQIVEAFPEETAPRFLL